MKLKTNRYWYNWVAIVTLLMLFLMESNPKEFWNPTVDSQQEIYYNK